RGALAARARRGPRCRARSADRREPGCDRASLRAASRVGLPHRPHGARSGRNAMTSVTVDEVRGGVARERTAVWTRAALVVLLAGTAVLYIVGLGASGYANSFYSAAVAAGSKSWKAFFFGSFDASNFITVDKPPASLWVMDLSARLFG